jgi:hypothetical protein
MVAFGTAGGDTVTPVAVVPGECSCGMRALSL